MSSVYKWSAIERIFNSVITFIGNIVLARLLTPYDFGLVAMIGIFISIAYNISGCGMSDGLIKKANPTNRDYSTVFVFNAVMGLAFCGLFLVISQSVAEFFKQPALQGIMCTLGICFFFSTLTFTQETRLRKELDLKKIAIVKILSTITSMALGIWLAITGYGYWALVSTRIFLSFFLFIYYLIIARWFPRVAFYKESFKELFSYGWHLMVSYVLTQFGRNINAFVLGKYSPAASGVFSQAQKLQEVPYSVIEAVFNWPFFAVLSNEQDEQRRRKLAQDMYVNILWVSVVVGLFLILLSTPGIKLLYGEKWIEAIPIFRILVIYGIFTAMKYYFQTILKTYGMTRIIQNFTFIEVVLQLALLVMSFKFGIFWIAFSQVVAVVLASALYLVVYMRIEKMSIMETIMNSVKPILVPLFAFGEVFLGYQLWNDCVSPFINVLLVVITFGIFFIGQNELIRPAVYMNYRNKIIKKGNSGHE